MVKSTVKILQDSVAFSEYINFKELTVFFHDREADVRDQNATYVNYLIFI